MLGQVGECWLKSILTKVQGNHRCSDTSEVVEHQLSLELKGDCRTLERFVWKGHLEGNCHCQGHSQPDGSHTGRKSGHSKPWPPPPSLLSLIFFANFPWSEPCRSQWAWDPVDTHMGSFRWQWAQQRRCSLCLTLSPWLWGWMSEVKYNVFLLILYL